MLFGAVFVLAPGTLGQADDLQGADALIKQLGSPAPPAAAPGATDPAQDTAAKFSADLDDFSQHADSLAPDDAARRWIALFERSLRLSPPGGQKTFSNISGVALSVLPGPAVWPALQKLAADHPVDAASPGAGPALRLILATLTTSESQQWTDLFALRKMPKPNEPMFRLGHDGGDPYLAIGAALSSIAKQKDSVEKFWAETLGTMAQAVAPAAGSSPVQVELPDLVTILGAAKAEPLVRQALLLPGAVVQEVSGAPTQELARKLALANVDQLHYPPWSLTASLEGAPLYEALTKKFPGDQDGRAYAIYYVIARVTQGKPDEAAKAAEGIDFSQVEDAGEQATRLGWGPQVYDFSHAFLKIHPESQLWNFYIDLAAQTGNAPEALAFVQSTAARADLSPAAREQVRSVLYRGLLAVDRVDEGIAELRALIKAEKAAPAPAPPSMPDLTTLLRRGGRSILSHAEDFLGPGEKMVGWDLQLARIGRLLKRDDLEKEGLDDAVETAQKLSTNSTDPMATFREGQAQSEVISYEVETGRYAQAEKALTAEMVAHSQTASKSFLRVPTFFDNQSAVQLATVYYQTGRWADIITLLEKYPGWGAADLVTVADKKTQLPRRSTPSLGLMAARALAETGRTSEAVPILDYVLDTDAGDDAAYMLLLKIGQGDLVAKLDALYRRDQFQERPLIWKAVLLLQQGNVTAAEDACKAAITVDPSDGEEGKGDRMRVYSVMADVCAAKKDDHQAGIFRNVVKAIRLSEDADDYYDAGLLTHAIGMYGQALGLFSDAYCIQSRIARQLAELGRLQEAAEHYRRAFELMPVSFGRLESHCFGCERAFAGKTAADIAHQTFTDMMAKDPQKPQIPYLLGYLEKEQQQFPEAVAHFYKAAQLDPDYINAWKNIAEIGKDHQIDPDLRDAAVFNLIRLDPAGRHVTPSLEDVRQLGQLWTVEAQANQAIAVPPKSLFPLTASARLHPGNDDDGTAIFAQMFNTGVSAEWKAWMELQKKSMMIGQRIYSRQGTGESPRSAVLRNSVIAGAMGYL